MPGRNTQQEGFSNQSLARCGAVKKVFLSFDELKFLVHFYHPVFLA